MTPQSPSRFAGFSTPVDNLPALNSVSAGQAIPVRFSLNGDHGLDIFAAGSPGVLPIACDSRAPVDDIETTSSAGQSSLAYDAKSGVYTYVWKTQKAWAGTCRELVLMFNDGTSYRANFKLGK